MIDTINIGELVQIINAFDPPGFGLEPPYPYSRMDSDEIPFYDPAAYIHWKSFSTSTTKLFCAWFHMTYSDWLSETQGTLGCIDYLGIIDLRLHKELHHPAFELWRHNNGTDDVTNFWQNLVSPEVPLLSQLRHVLAQLPQQTLIKNSFLISDVENLFKFWNSLPNPYIGPPIYTGPHGPNPLPPMDLSVQGAAFLEVMRFVP
jgi:hypothetical protein